MAGKACVFCSPKVAAALDCLTKNTMADIIVDLVRPQLSGGVDEPIDDGELLELLQLVIEPAMRARKQKLFDLAEYADKWAASDAKWQERRREITERRAAQQHPAVL